MVEYEYQEELRMSEKEQREMSEKINEYVKSYCSNFLKGLFFFLTVPYYFVKLLKKKKCGL